MNFLFKNSMCLDLRNGSISITGMRRYLRRVKIMDARDYPLVATTPSEKAKRDGIISGMEDFFDRNGANWDEIIVILSRKAILYRHVWFPSTVKQNLSTTIQFEIETFSPFTKEDIVYDYKIIEETSDGSKICVLLSLIKKKSYEDIVDAFKRFALKPSAILGSPTIWVELDRLFGKKTPCDSFLITQEENDLILNTYSLKGIRDSVLYENPAHLVNDISEKFKEKDEVPPVFLWGEGLENYEDLLKEKGITATKISASQFSERLRCNSKEAYNEQSIRAFCASETIENMPDVLNLIPIHERPKKGRYVYYIFWVLIVFVFLSLAFLSAVPFFKQAVTIENLEKEISSLSVNVDAINAKKTEIERYLARLKEIENIRDSNPLDALKELTVILPKHTWLTYFRKKGEAIEVGGISESANSLIPILESSPFFRDVSFSSPVVKGKEGTETFRVRMYLE